MVTGFTDMMDFLSRMANSQSFSHNFTIFFAFLSIGFSLFLSFVFISVGKENNNLKDALILSGKLLFIACSINYIALNMDEEPINIDNSHEILNVTDGNSQIDCKKELK